VKILSKETKHCGQNKTAQYERNGNIVFSNTLSNNLVIISLSDKLGIISQEKIDIKTIMICA
jgi:hypothetical protein